MTDGDAITDVRPARPWRVPGWTWIILHFAFVASLAVVWHRREPWVLRFSVGDGSYQAMFWLSKGDDPRLTCLDQTGLRVWDVGTGKEIGVLRGGSARAWSDAAMSADGSRFATACGRFRRNEDSDRQEASDPHLIDIWNTKTGEIVETLRHPVPSESEGSVWVCLSPDGRSAMTYAESYSPCYDPLLKPSRSTAIWDIRVGEWPLLLKGLPLTGYSSDGGKVAIGQYFERPVVYDAKTGVGLCRLGEHVPPVCGRFSPDGARLLTWQEDAATVREWDAASGRQLMAIDAFTARELEETETSWSPRAKFGYTPDGHMVIGRAPCGFRIWRRPSGELLRDMPGCLAMGFSSDSRYALAAIGDGPLELQRVADGASIYSSEACAARVAFAGHDCFIIADAGDNRVYVLDRRFPEWWWGHFYRPEVWAAVAIGAAWLWSVARWARGRMRERRAGGEDATPPTA